MNHRRQQALRWAPAVLLLVGAALTSGAVRQQQAVALRQPLNAIVPATMDGFQSQDISISEEEQRVAGMSSYLMRAYTAPGAAEAAAFSVYVGYYDQQRQGKTIHSPKNCLPGSGWEPLASRQEQIATPGGAVAVNRYLLQNGSQQALVLYWYQGRGRVTANEYLVKWHLLRDQALRGRSDEALVRIIVPVAASEEAAYRTAVQVARTLVPAVDQALPVI